MTIEKLLLAVLGRDRAWRLGRRLYVAARGEKATNAIASNGEADLIGAVLQQIGDAPAVLWDVGANQGEWSASVLAQAAGRPLRLDLFEPSGRAAEALGPRFSGPDRQVHGVALSDRTGLARFALVGEGAGTNSLELDSVEGPADVVEVETVRGADFAARIGVTRIDLLKIDTEGHDFAVLEGFEAMFVQDAIGIAQFEYNSRWLAARRSLRDVFGFAQRHGYSLGRVVSGGIELFDRWNPECDRFFEDNYALVSPAWSGASFVQRRAWSPSNTLR